MRTILITVAVVCSVVLPGCSWFNHKPPVLTRMPEISVPDRPKSEWDKVEAATKSATFRHFDTGIEDLRKDPGLGKYSDLLTALRDEYHLQNDALNQCRGNAYMLMRYAKDLEARIGAYNDFAQDNNAEFERQLQKNGVQTTRHTEDEKKK